MLIRAETAADHRELLAVVAAAFQRPNQPQPPEAALQQALMDSAEYLPELSLVADDGGEIVGQVITTRAWIADFPALGLGPLSVRPDRQGRGIGAELVRCTVETARTMGESSIALLEDPAYYQRFGFRPAADFGVRAPVADWAEYFQLLLLGAQPPPPGRFRYAEPFQRL